MNLFYLTWRNVWSRPLSSVLSIALIAMGTGLVSLLLQINPGMNDQITRNVGGIDMVIGAKGAPLQLILSSVLQMDDPVGNIFLDEAEPFMRNPMVKTAIPLAYGDNFRGYRIVGTSQAYLDLYQAKLNEGSVWQKPFEAVIGSGVARQLNVQPGDRFEGSHGLAAAGQKHEQDYIVTGILSPTGTVLDQLIVTSLESVWESHSDHNKENVISSQPIDSSALSGTDPSHNEREITAVLLSFQSPLGTLTMGRLVNENSNMQAAVPAFEISKLNQRLGLGTETLRAFGLVLLLLAGLSVFAALYQAMEDRRYELAVLRAMGATARRIAGLLASEGLLLASLGAISGMALSRISLWLINQQLQSTFHQVLNGSAMLEQEGWLLAGAFAIGLLAALIPAFRALQMNVSEELGKG